MCRTNTNVSICMTCDIKSSSDVTNRGIDATLTIVLILFLESGGRRVITRGLSDVNHAASTTRQA